MGILFAPVTLLVVLFLGPMVIMATMSLVKFPPNTTSGYTFDHYVDVLTNPLNWKIAWTTLWIGTTAMVIMLAIAIPLAYYMVFRAGQMGAVPAAVAGAGRRACAGGQGLRLAGDPGPQRHPQLADPRTAEVVAAVQLRSP